MGSLIFMKSSDKEVVSAVVRDTFSDRKLEGFTDADLRRKTFKRSFFLSISVLKMLIVSSKEAVVSQLLLTSSSMVKVDFSLGFYILVRNIFDV